MDELREFLQEGALVVFFGQSRWLGIGHEGMGLDTPLLRNV